METIPPTIEPQSQPMADQPLAGKKKSLLVPVLLGLTVVILGGIFGLLLQQNSNPAVSLPTASPSPTPTSTPTTNQPLSDVASTSAFIEMESGIASLSAAVAALNISDTALNPPSLDLPLGLETK
jgi:glycerol uptake facilitator-like aquaporin